MAAEQQSEANVEHPVESDIRAELVSVGHNVTAIEREIQALGGHEQLGRQLKAKGATRVFFEKFAMVATLLGAFIGGKAIGDHIPKFREAFLGHGDTSGSIEPGGKNLYSEEHVREQKEWLEHWISERKTRPDDDPEHTIQQAIQLLKEIRVTNENLGEAAGRYTPYGNRRVALDIGSNDMPGMGNVPVHELTHASTKGGFLIGKKEKAIIGQVTKSAEEYHVVSEKFYNAHQQKLQLPSHAYLTSPDEFKAFLMASRKALGLGPNQMVDDNMIDEMYERHAKGELKDYNLDRMIDIIKDKQSFQRALNELSDNSLDQGIATNSADA